MLFNSIDFALFLPIVFILYWFVTQRHLKLQNALLVIVSYVFYGWWDWRFLSLIIFSSLVDFSIGVLLSKEENQTKRKLLLWTSIFINLGLLGFFKYYNFFLENFIEAFSFFGKTIKPSSLHIILPVGISFYTFQTLSYTIDVYKRKLQPTRDLVSFLAFVSFFPQLVAGPIERATNLLPQFYKKRKFNYSQSVDGMRQIIWGLVKKIVIADNCAAYVNIIFNNYTDYKGSTLFLGAIFFTFQIYGDFSGYSDIAIGISRLFGFNLKQNFAFPYFSRDIAEFWRRWHISLSTWFKDYLYIPLGGSRGGTLVRLRNVFIIFIVSGFWHGANWTYIVWGGVNALYFLPVFITNNNRNNLDTIAQGKYMPNIKDGFSVLLTFLLTVFAWIFFRAENLGVAFKFVSQIFSTTFFSIPELRPSDVIVLIIIFIIIEWIGRDKKFALEHLNFRCSKILRFLIYILLAMAIILYSGGKEQQFIYFQF